MKLSMPLLLATTLTVYASSPREEMLSLCSIQYARSEPLEQCLERGLSVYNLGMKEVFKHVCLKEYSGPLNFIEIKNTIKCRQKLLMTNATFAFEFKASINKCTALAKEISAMTGSQIIYDGWREELEVIAINACLNS